MSKLSKSNKETIKAIINRKFDPISDKINDISNKMSSQSQQFKLDTPLFEEFHTIAIKSENIESTRKYLYPLPPYNFIVTVVKSMISQQTTFKEYMSQSISHQAINILSHIDNLINEDVNNNLRLVEIDKNLIPLIESTDNKISYRPLFFETIFINNQFDTGKILVKGFLIHDIGNNYFIILPLINKSTMEVRIELFYLISKRKDKALDYIREIILNIVDLVEANDEDLDTVIIESNKEQNIKRINKGNIPYPTKVYIRPKEHFKKYINTFNEDANREKRKVGHKFLVRGHWRYFKSERYSAKTRDTPKWIKPFYKGHGILIKKEYKVME